MKKMLWIILFLLIFVAVFLTIYDDRPNPEIMLTNFKGSDKVSEKEIKKITSFQLGEYSFKLEKAVKGDNTYKKIKAGNYTPKIKLNYSTKYITPTLYLGNYHNKNKQELNYFQIEKGQNYSLVVRYPVKGNSIKNIEVTLNRWSENYNDFSIIRKTQNFFRTIYRDIKINSVKMFYSGIASTGFIISIYAIPILLLLFILVLTRYISINRFIKNNKNEIEKYKNNKQDQSIPLKIKKSRIIKKLQQDGKWKDFEFNFSIGIDEIIGDKKPRDPFVIYRIVLLFSFIHLMASIFSAIGFGIVVFEEKLGYIFIVVVSLFLGFFYYQIIAGMIRKLLKK